MSYKNIPRKCSVCQCCGTCDCDYEYEVEELGKISGDYNQYLASLMDKRTDKQKLQDITELFNKQ